MLAPRSKWNRRQFHSALLCSLGVITMPRGLLAKDVQSTETPNLVNANNAFALELLKTVSKKDPQKNQFFSPFSIQSALTIALEGARNQTAWQMGEALQYPESLKQQGGTAWNMTTLRKEFLSISKRLQPDDSQKAQELRKKVAKLRADLKKANETSEQLSRSNKYQEANAKYQEASKLADQINALAKQVDQYELRNANSLWIDASFKISPKYQSIIAENYRPTEAIATNFREQPEVERKRINDWVATQTEDKIRDIVPKGTIDEQTRLVIANAIYFKGTWSEPFAENATQTAEFTGRDASTKSVSMMRASQYESAKYAAFNADGSRFETPKMVDEDFDEVKGYPANDGYQVAELPYNGDAISMMIFLPRNPKGLDTLLSTLSVTQVDTCAKQLEGRQIRLSIPKFKSESTYDLKPTLESLGMRDAFDSSKADFGGLTEVDARDHQLYITAAIHKAFVDVNEKGTEAAAATIVTFAPRSALVTKRPFIPEFTADRPFVYLIRDKATGLILFLGKMEQPA